jgi:hypothetical protein
MSPRNIFTAYQVARQGQKYYGVGMKIVQKIKSRVRLIIIVIAIYALTVLGLLVYIAARVS